MTHQINNATTHFIKKTIKNAEYTIGKKPDENATLFNFS